MGEEKKEDAVKVDESDETEEEPEEEVEDDEKPPKVELTAEDKACPFRKLPVKDLTPYDFSTSFTNFTIPEGDEGFDDIKYEWLKTPTKCKAFMTDYKLSRKISTRIEDLQPSTWFTQEFKKWQLTLQKWHSK